MKYYKLLRALDNFAFALRIELEDTAITVSCLMPGATETEFFRRADMMDTRVGQEKKASPADVARDGFDAMMQGEAEINSGWGNKIRATLARVTPPTVLAEQHRKMAEPGSARRKLIVRHIQGQAAQSNSCR